MNAATIQLVECPRDAMQGWPNVIPTDKKISYLNTLLKVGFHTLDCGSFVSPKVIPQMADTKQVLAGLDTANSSTKLLVIVANVRGAEEAVLFDNVTYLGFPFSISETFQQRNANSSIAESVERLRLIGEVCQSANKQLVVYISMAFGNPYGDEYNANILAHWASRLNDLGISIISLSDTVGVATPEQVSAATRQMISLYPHIQTGVHLHSQPNNWLPKLEAALQAGCTRFDGALNGIGGCPMAGNTLVGNMNTAWMADFLLQHNYNLRIDQNALENALNMARQIFM